MNEKLYERIKDKDDHIKNISSDQEITKMQYNTYQDKSYNLEYELEKIKNDLNYTNTQLKHEKYTNESLKSEISNQKDIILEKQQNEMNFTISLEKSHVENLQLKNNLLKAEREFEVLIENTIN